MAYKINNAEGVLLNDNADIRNNAIVLTTDGGAYLEGWLDLSATWATLGFSGDNYIEVNATETVINRGGGDYNFRVEGDNEQNLLFSDASTDRVGIGTATPSAKLDVRGSVIFNEAGGDFDFRVEGDTAQNLLKVDAGLDRVGINEATPDGKLHVSSLEGVATLVIDGMTDAGIVGPHQRYTKQGEASTIGTGTSTIATISLPTSNDRLTMQGMITAIAGSTTIGGNITVVAQNITGTVSIVGTPVVNVMENATGSPTFSATTTGTNVLIQATGGGTNTSWIMTYDYQILNGPTA